MKVQKCNAPALDKPAAKKYTYAQMCAEEGVYFQSGARGGARFVVIKDSSNTTTAVLFASENLLESASYSWKDGCITFEKIENAVVCFEIKEG